VFVLHKHWNKEVLNQFQVRHFWPLGWFARLWVVGRSGLRPHQQPDLDVREGLRRPPEAGGQGYATSKQFVHHVDLAELLDDRPKRFIWAESEKQGWRWQSGWSSYQPQQRECSSRDDRLVALSGVVYKRIIIGCDDKKNLVKLVHIRAANRCRNAKANLIAKVIRILYATMTFNGQPKLDNKKSIL